MGRKFFHDAFALVLSFMEIVWRSKFDCGRNAWMAVTGTASHDGWTVEACQRYPIPNYFNNASHLTYPRLLLGASRVLETLSLEGRKQAFLALTRNLIPLDVKT